jgi:ABC-type branched-subunit amino acid transport system substrate-binding protein
VTRITARARVLMSALAGMSVLAVLGGCSAAPVPTPTPTASATLTPLGDGVLRVGTLMPVTGTFGFLGGAQVAAVAVAVAEINAAGGVNGVPVEILPRDSADASTTTAEASLADLVTNKADVVIGPTSSVLADRLIPGSAKAGIPMISPAATFPDLTAAADSGYFFRTIPPYGDQGAVLAQVLSEKGGVKAALVYVNDELGRAILPTFTAGLTAHGSGLVASEGIPSSATDFAPFIAEVVAAKPDVVVLATAYSSFDLTKALISQLLAAGFGGAKLWLTTQNTGDYSQAFPNGTLSGVNGIIEGAQPDDAFIARLKAVDGALGTFRYAPEAYDATIMAALAAVVAQDDAGMAISKALQAVSRGGIKCTTFAECLEVIAAGDDIDYDGISGPLNLTDAGDPTPAYYGLYVYNGENKFDFTRGIVAG